MPFKCRLYRYMFLRSRFWWAWFCKFANREPMRSSRLCGWGGYCLWGLSERRTSGHWQGRLGQCHGRCPWRQIRRPRRCDGEMSDWLYILSAWWRCVLRFDMTSQVDFSLKGATALVAGKRLEPGVFARVGDEIGWLAERFPAYQAFMRFLTCINRKEHNTSAIEYHLLHRIKLGASMQWRALNPLLI